MRARRGVEEAQPHELVVHVEVGAARAVHEELVAEHAGEAACAALANAVGREAGVLHDERARRRRRTRAAAASAASASSCTRNMPARPRATCDSRLAVRVRVVPERRRRLVDVPLGRPRGARLDHLVRAAVHLGRQVHAVPVHGRRHVERVGDVDAHVLAPLRDERRAEVRAVEAPGVARHARRELGASRPGPPARRPACRRRRRSTVRVAGSRAASSKSTVPTVDTGAGPTSPQPANDDRDEGTAARAARAPTAARGRRIPRGFERVAGMVPASRSALGTPHPVARPDRFGGCPPAVSGAPCVKRPARRVAATGIRRRSSTDAASGSSSTTARSAAAPTRTDAP